MDIVAAIIGALILAQFIDGRVAFAIGVLSIVAFRMVRHHRARIASQQLGLSPDEAALLQEDLQRGDRDAALRRIEAAQERHRAEFKATTGIDVRAITPEIGREISWTDIVRQVFRVCDFERGDTKIGPNDQVRASSLFSPYGFLLVESPILNQRARLPIIHRDDFRLAASFFDRSEVAEFFPQLDLLVTYAPEHLLPGGLSGSLFHVLHYVIAPRGTLERYYAVGDDVHFRDPKPEKVFGQFVYEGEFKIQAREPTL